MSRFRVAIYLRLSDEDNHKANKFDNSESIKNQRLLLLEEIRKHKEYILMDEYCDENLSGAGTYRPEFERLIRDCHDGKIDIVMCKSQSRFSRDMEIIEKYLHNKFLEWNVRFISLVDAADTNNIGNKKARQINGLVNEWYLEDVSNNIRSAFKTKMTNGEFISPFPSYGYKISARDNNKLVIDKIASNTVRKIFRLYLQGYGFYKIAKYLNDKMIPSPSYYKYQNGCKLNIVSDKPREKIIWSSNAVKRILTNEIYIGNLVQGKRTTISYKNHKIKEKSKDMWIRYENAHEAIIDREDFYKVQERIKLKTRPILKSGCVHIFSGMVFCLECNSCMRKKNSGKYQYLVCSTDDCSNHKSIRYDKLEKMILKCVQKKFHKYYNQDLIESIIKKNNYNLKTIESLELERKKLLKKVNNNRLWLENLYEDRINKIITTKEFRELIHIYKERKTKYLNRIQEIDKEIDNYKCNDDFLNHKLEILVLDRAVINEFIQNIYIGKIDGNERRIYINWNF